MRRLLLTLLAAWLAGPAFAAPPVAINAPYRAPAGEADVGAATSCPIAVLATGQSNQVSQDHNGAHANPANTFITNSYTAPTGFVAATYGSPPLDLGYSGSPNGGTFHTSMAALTYVSQSVAFANAVRAHGVVTAPIYLLTVAAGAQSIGDWVSPSVSLAGASISGTTLTVPTAPSINTTYGTGQVNVGYALNVSGSPTIVSQLTNTDPNGSPGKAGTYQISASLTVGAQSVTATAPFNMQAAIAQAVSAYQALYPNCGLTLVDWLQGEQDSSVSSFAFNSQAIYGAAFTNVLVPFFQSLSIWSPQTRWVNVPLPRFFDNTGQARNDFLDTTRDGRLFPWMTEIDASGCEESPDNPIPHYRGDCQNLIGQRLYQAWNVGRISGFYSQKTTYSGGAEAKPSLISTPTPATCTANASGYVLTVSACASGTIATGAHSWLSSAPSGLVAGTLIMSQTSGTTGGAGNYTLNQSQTFASGTILTGYALGVDDIINGGLVIANEPINLPNAGSASGQSFRLAVAGGNWNIGSAGTLTIENVGSLSGGTTKGLAAGETYEVVQSSATSWLLLSKSPATGNLRFCTAAYTSAQTLTSTLQNHCIYSLSGNNTYTLTPTFGVETWFYNQSGTATVTLSAGVFSMPDGTTPTSITLGAGEFISLVGVITGTTSLAVRIGYDSIERGTRSGGVSVTALNALGCSAANDGMRYLANTLSALPAFQATLPATDPAGSAEWVYVCGNNGSGSFAWRAM